MHPAPRGYGDCTEVRALRQDSPESAALGASYTRQMSLPQICSVRAVTSHGISPAYACIADMGIPSRFNALRGICGCLLWRPPQLRWLCPERDKPSIPIAQASVNCLCVRICGILALKLVRETETRYHAVSGSAPARTTRHHVRHVHHGEQRGGCVGRERQSIHRAGQE